MIRNVKEKDKSKTKFAPAEAFFLHQKFPTRAITTQTVSGTISLSSIKARK